MPTSVFTCIGNGVGYTNGTAVGAATKWGCLTTDNADTSYLYFDAASTMSFTADMSQPLDISAAGSILNVSSKFKYRADAAGHNVNGIIYLGGTAIIGTSQACTTSYVTYTETSTAKPGGGLWVLADVYAMEIGFRKTATQLGRCTYLTGESSWVEAPGFFSCLVSSLLGAFAGLGAADIVGLADKLASMRGWRLEPHEYARFWADLRASRYPRHFVLAR